MNCCRRAEQSGQPVPCTEDEYHEALEVLPPVAYFKHGFAMGEPYDGWGTATRYFCFFHFKDTGYWCWLAPLLGMREVASISERGIGYSTAKENA